MSKIGIMGGTFNPVHNVHLILAEEARRQFGLKKILFMPSKNPPHKEKREIVSEEHRKRMIQHAIQDNPHFKFSDIEWKREGTTYTRDTLAYLRKKYPEHEFYFIVGGDSLAALETWRDPAFIFQNCHMLAANRDGVNRDKILKWITFFREKYQAVISEIQLPSLSISSEMIREKVKKGESIAGYCPEPVERYIRINRLYGFQKKLPVSFPDSETEIMKFLSACQKPGRFTHTLGVAVTSANLASVHGADASKAYLAGLLHDCAKYLTGEEQIQECERAGITLSPIERENTALIHGKLGAYYARTRYGVEEPEILSAITYHTTGRPEMSLLEKIVYLADYMEPGREMKCKPFSLEEIRKASFQNIDQALTMVLECCVGFLKKSARPIDSLTLETYEYYREQNGGNYA